MVLENTLSPVVNRYSQRQTRRWEHGRNIKETEAEWRTEKEFALPSVDEAIAEQIEHALARGEQQLTVLDIGCGRAGLFADSI